jgi:hypothetical protein
MPAGQPWVGSVVKIAPPEVVSKLNALKGMDTCIRRCCPLLRPLAAPSMSNGVTVVLLKDGSSTNGKNLVQLPIERLQRSSQEGREGCHHGRSLGHHFDQSADPPRI